MIATLCTTLGFLSDRSHWWHHPSFFAISVLLPPLYRWQRVISDEASVCVCMCSIFRESKFRLARFLKERSFPVNPGRLGFVFCLLQPLQSVSQWWKIPWRRYQTNDLLLSLCAHTHTCSLRCYYYYSFPSPWQLLPACPTARVLFTVTTELRARDLVFNCRDRSDHSSLNVHRGHMINVYYYLTRPNSKLLYPGGSTVFCDLKRLLTL